MHSHPTSTAENRLVVDGDTLRLDGNPVVRTHLALQAMSPIAAHTALRRLAACWAICEGLDTAALEAAAAKRQGAHKLLCHQVLASESVNAALLGMVKQLTGALGVCVSRLAERDAEDGKGIDADMASLRTARELLARMGAKS